MDRPTPRDISNAAKTLHKYGVKHTGLVPSHALARMCDLSELQFKTENLQLTGAYKIRGATYFISQLTPAQLRVGVVTASAGNHGQGVAWAARRLNSSSIVVIPETAPEAKEAAIKGYSVHFGGDEVLRKGKSYEDAAKEAHRIAEETGRIYVPAFDHPNIIAGQATVGIEIMADWNAVDAVLVGVGGGGLISGIATWMHFKHKHVQVIGVEAAGAASMCAALQHGAPVELPSAVTIADGIKTKTVGAMTFAITRDFVGPHQVVTVSEEEIQGHYFISPVCKGDPSYLLNKNSTSLSVIRRYNGCGIARHM